ncbi:GNAT family N-acetyltransferase [Pelagibius sp. CAU 1746]|uniref:GNAT family N-acetyltransferase n=1 Tax=Pelagibius sp. CAU 1746 TaxID=3140370 RepID=UPI00325A6E75
MTNPEIRRATAEDVPAIVDFLADDELGKTREAPGDPCYAETFAAIAADPNQFLAVVDDGGAVVGCLQLTFIPGLSLKAMWRGQIESVRIASSRRGQGLGHVMIDWAVAECRRRGCGLVQLTMNKSRTDSHRFYESLGFEATHEGFKLVF